MKRWGIPLLFLSAVLPARAALSFSLESVNPSMIYALEQEVEVKLNITDLPSESYFRVAWKKEGSSTYFGYVKNQDGNWAKIEFLSSDCKNYYKVSDTGTTTLTLTTKIGTDSNLEAGNYLLKAHRFTSSCASNSGSENELIVTLNLPTPAPSPTPTPTPTPMPTPTPRSSPTPARSAPPSVAGGPTPPASPSPTGSTLPAGESGVLAAVSDASMHPTAGATPEKPTPSPRVLGAGTETINWMAVGVMIIGGCVFGLAIYLLIRRAGTMEK